MTTRSGEVSDEEVLEVLERLRKDGDNPSAFLALNSGNAYFTHPATDGVVAYREAGSYLIQFGGVHAPPEQREALLRAFLAHARRRRRKVVAVQVLTSDVELYVRCGFTVNQVGSSYSVHLPDFALRGTRFMKLRNKISRARRSGLEVTEVSHEECAAEIAGIDGAWLRSKGRHVKEIEFLVGELGGPVQHARRLMLGRLDGVPIAYISYSPAYGSRPGWLHDLSRRLPDAPPGVMEAINLTALETFRQEGAEWLHFGFTPFTGLSAEHDPAEASGATRRIMRLLADHGDKVYPAASQLAYKEKWGPQLVLPEYLAFHGRARLGAIWQILRVTKSV
ncbi:bifunctional lysylphosphatidylglycerol flippase/synthetase MprF [Streptomyces sp. NPDC059863]|uniref:bifunctional lysylphosphatidylglycerol flippase/synthetase MprF n=1 Tax=unclassified Streptomyces TaxID=2593676 RepID=UPI0036517AC6